MDDAVDHCGGDDLVSEDAGPGAEWQVAGQDEGGVFVAGGDELEEEVGGVLLEGEVADLVDDDQPVAAQPGQFGGEAATVVGLVQSGDPVGGGGEQDPVSLPAGGDPEGGGQVAPAGAWWAEQDDGEVLGQVGTGSQGPDRGRGTGLDVAGGILEGLDPWQARRAGR